jgi:hypothetical protein
MNGKSGLVCGYTGDTMELEAVTCMHYGILHSFRYLILVRRPF